MLKLLSLKLLPAVPGFLKHYSKNSNTKKLVEHYAKGPSKKAIEIAQQPLQASSVTLNRPKGSSFKRSKIGSNFKKSGPKGFSRGISTASIPKELSRPIKIPEDPVKITELVEKFATTRQMDDAIALMFLSHHRLKEPIIPWNVLLSHLAEKGRLKYSLKLFTEMKKHGVKPNDRTYTILLNCCSKARAPTASAKAEKLLQEMKMRSLKVANVYEKGTNTSDSNKEIEQISGAAISKITSPTVHQPTLFHYNNLLKVYSRSGNLLEMVELYDSMRSNILDPKQKSSKIIPAPDIISYTVCANAFGHMKTDASFVQGLGVWMDQREDFQRHMGRQSTSLAFDVAFLEALVLGSRYCHSSDNLHKGLEMLDMACGLKLNVTYPSTETYKALPTLNPQELEYLAHSLEQKPRPQLLDLALHLLSRLGYDHQAPKIFFIFTSPLASTFKPSLQPIDPDLLHFASVLSSIAHHTKSLLQPEKGSVPSSMTPRHTSDKRSPSRQPSLPPTVPSNPPNPQRPYYRESFPARKLDTSPSQKNLYD